MNTHALGRRGERKTAWWHWRRGFRIVTVGFRVRRGELDVVALRRGTLHIIEVKTRTVGGEAPGNALTVEKRRRILRAARVFLRRSKVPWERLSFDLAEVHVSRWRTRIEVRRDVFRADDAELRRGVSE